MAGHAADPRCLRRRGQFASDVPTEQIREFRQKCGLRSEESFVLNVDTANVASPELLHDELGNAR